MYINIENHALARVLDECDALKHVFYRMFASEMVLWLEFWKRSCALARVLEGSERTLYVFDRQNVCF